MDFKAIRTLYAKMMYKIRCIFKKSPPPLDDIIEFLSCFSNTLRKKADDCDSLTTVLRLIEDECSLIDVQILHSVIEEIEIAEAEECIKKYLSELDKFCKTLSVNLCLKERFDSVSHLQCEMATYIFDWEPEEHVLKDIKDILSKVSGKLMRIKYINTGSSILVTCSFPFTHMGLAVTMMVDNFHVLLQHGLKKLTIGSLILWRRHDVMQKVC